MLSDWLPPKGNPANFASLERSNADYNDDDADSVDDVTVSFPIMSWKISLTFGNPQIS